MHVTLPAILFLLSLVLQSAPPKEVGPFREPDLVELTALDPTIRLDIRYATANNLAGRAVYTEARAFLQRPAAEALVRAHREMSPRAYPDYDQGPLAARERRDLLRAVMEREGFTVEPNEWWHFNYKDWKAYPILDIPFSEIRPSGRWDLEGD